MSRKNDGKGRRRKTSGSQTAARANPTSQTDESYSGFGEHGPLFENLRITTWREASLEWKRIRSASKRTLPFLQTLPKDYGETFRQELGLAKYYLYILLQSAMSLRDKKAATQKVRAIWDSDIRFCLGHDFGTANTLFPNHKSLDDTKYIFRPMSAGVIKADPASLTRSICYGHFSASEANYVCRNCSGIIEAGCGSGYALKYFYELGIDVFGFDTNVYEMSDDQDYPWAQELLSLKRIRIADVDEIEDSCFRNRALLISWPLSTFTFPSRTLKKFTELGGEVFLFKPGGYIPFKWSSELDELIEFFTTLNKDWGLVDTSQHFAFSTSKLENNLYVFHRR